MSDDLASTAFGLDDFVAATAVSRETRARLETYATLLRQWQSRVNLIGPATYPDLWRRHFLDSAQLLPLLPETPDGVADLGAGAGFPGLVLAIMGVAKVHLIESDGRKVAFLREVARITETPVTIHYKRIEAISDLAVSVVTARALAPLTRLLPWAVGLLAPGGQCLFLKGRQGEEELTAAHKDWNMRIDRLRSRSDPGGVIFRLSEISRV
ncbi:MAG: 16S rRNA (guanine(527)-N(7))-methyltransferase RsmG [Azospirillaceae bacterium]|nr:16S rRNA (guanine(527)-N(7))-methyltransferase RsmG [Azospirillaceae bacterium]